jgi:ATP-dependent Clp protease ATP-binding subunit ClpB
LPTFTFPSYITERYLPDKAIDLIDEAASALRLQQESRPDELESLERDLITLQIELESLRNDRDVFSQERRAKIEEEIASKRQEANRLEEVWREERARLDAIKHAKEMLERANYELEDAQRQGNFQKASELRYSTIPQLEAQIPREGEEDDASKATTLLHDRVTSDDVALVVSKVCRRMLCRYVFGVRRWPMVVLLSGHGNSREKSYARRA